MRPFRQRNTEQINDFFGRLFPEDTEKTRFITFQVTEDCNLRCSYCYQINKKKNRMTFETAKKLVDKLFEGDWYLNESNSSAIILDFIGGEPLLEIELIDQIVTYFTQQAILHKSKWVYRHFISISSNGTLYFDERVQQFLRKYNNYVSFNITLDGNKKLHDSCRIFPDGSGSFDLVESAMKHYVANYKPMSSKITLCPQNVDEMYEAIVNMVDLDYKDINANFVFEDVWTVDDAKKFYGELKRLADFIIERDIVDSHYVSLFNEHVYGPADRFHFCGSGTHMLALDYKGDIFPCFRFTSTSAGDNREEYTIGNIDTGMFTTPDQQRRFDCLQCDEGCTKHSDKCADCPIGKGCAWCVAQSHYAFGDVTKRTTFSCQMHQAQCAANAYMWNKFYKAKGIDEVFQINLPEEWALEFLDKSEWDMLKQMEAERAATVTLLNKKIANSKQIFHE